MLLNGFFALSEMALVSARRSRLQARAEHGSRGAQIALGLLEDSTRFLSAVQIGVTLIGIVTGVYSGATLAAHLDDVIAAWGVPMAYAEEIAFGAIVLAVTFVTLVLGELAPKRIALDNAETLAELFRAFIALGVKPYYLHHADLAPGTAHFRTSIAEGQAIMRALRGRVSGLALPTYVLDVPGGFGKVPIGPDYVHEIERFTEVTDVSGRQHAYPAIPADIGPIDKG